MILSLDQQLARIAAALREPAPATRHSYYIVMRDFGRRGREAIVDPEITRDGVIARIRSHEYDAIAFIHFVEVDENGIGRANDVTNDLLAAAGFYDQEAAE